MSEPSMADIGVTVLIDGEDVTASAEGLQITRKRFPTSESPWRNLPFEPKPTTSAVLTLKGCAPPEGAEVRISRTVDSGSYLIFVGEVSNVVGDASLAMIELTEPSTAAFTQYEDRT